MPRYDTPTWYISVVGGLIGISLPPIIALADTVMINLCDLVHSIEKASWTCQDELLPWEVHRIWEARGSERKVRYHVSSTLLWRL